MAVLGRGFFLVGKNNGGHQYIRVSEILEIPVEITPGICQNNL
jgi:hypothetical protein